jgi:hypothetical protein
MGGIVEELGARTKKKKISRKAAKAQRFGKGEEVHKGHRNGESEGRCIPRLQLQRMSAPAFVRRAPTLGETRRPRARVQRVECEKGR